MRHAKKTTVSPEKSRLEIERIITNYGAQEFLSGWKDGEAVIGFKLGGISIRMHLPLPDKQSDDIKLDFRGYLRGSKSLEAAYQQAIRQRWRAMLLVVKAKLEAVETGIATIEQEFLAHIVMPDGRTIGERFIPQLENMSQLPKLLTA